MALLRMLSHQGRWLLLLCAVAVVLTGCKGLRLRESDEADVAASDDPDSTDSELAAESKQEQIPELSSAWNAALADKHWVQSAADGSKHRWRHAMIDAELARPNQPTAGLTSATRCDSPVIRANAAIALARAGQQAPPETLVAAIRDRQLPLSLRLAAAETLGADRSATARQSLRELIAEYGRFGDEFNKQYVAELHGELVYAIGRGDKASDPAIVAALRSPSALPRLEAIRLWAADRTEDLPEAVVDLRADPDARIRAASLKALAGHGHAQAAEHLEAGLSDYDLNVRRAAVAGLGILGNQRARQRLERLLKSDAEVMRAEAVAALAAMQADDAVAAAISDKSWRVRAEIAKALAERPDSPLALLAEDLIRDASPVVQERAVAAIATWPQEQAVPLLLAALSDASYLARKAARQQLVRHWPPADRFALDAPPERRAEVLAELRERFARQRVGGSAQLAQLAQPESVLPAAVPGEVMACLDQLAASDVDQRRRAADKLLELSADTSLSDDVMQRMADTVSAESDALVWRSVLAAIADEASPTAFRLVYAAASHPAAEIRRRSCEHLARHAAPRHAGVLLPSLGDEDTSVARLAARALGASGAKEHAHELEPLLTSSDKQVRLEAAVSLSRLGSPQGPTALQRLAFDNDPAIRREAALAMGKLGDRAFVPVLLELLDDHGGVCQASLTSLAEIAGRDVARGENSSQPPPSAADAIERWKQWGKTSRTTDESAASTAQP